MEILNIRRRLPRRYRSSQRQVRDFSQ